MSSRTSPLERRILAAMVSLIRDRETDPEFMDAVDIPLKALYERLYVPGDRPHEAERRNQRQAQRRALARMHADGLVWPLALAWVSVTDEQVIRWQGGGRRKRDGHGHGVDTPNWRMLSLTQEGLALAFLIEAS